LDEAGSWLLALGETSALKTRGEILGFWNGGGARHHRKNSLTVAFDYGCLTIIAGCQPSLFGELAATSRDDGLLERFQLLVRMADKPWQGPPEAKSFDVTAIDALFAAAVGGDTLREIEIIPFEAVAKTRFQAWYSDNHGKMRSTRENNPRFSAWLSKHATGMAAIAGVLSFAAGEVDRAGSGNLDRTISGFSA
jgi:hypothetical protein